RLEAAVCPDAVDQRQPVADFVTGDLQHAALLIGRARGHLGRMRVDRDRRQALDACDIAQMAAKRRLVDRQIILERQQHRGAHSLGHEILEASHRNSPMTSTACPWRAISDMTENVSKNARPAETNTPRFCMMAMPGPPPVPVDICGWGN